MGLFWQIVVFLIVAAALGFVIGWVFRAARSEGDQAGAAPRHAGQEASLADERDRLRTELQAARDAQAKLEGSLAEAQGLADTRASRVRELEEAETGSRQRIARLEQELGDARAGSVSQGETGQKTTPPTTAGAAPPPSETVEGAPPPSLPSPEGEPDDLKKISGIGPSIEKTLHELGIYHFRQIAAFTPDNIAWVNQRLRFKGRIEREDWVGQASKLAAGEMIDQA